MPAETFFAMLGPAVVTVALFVAGVISGDAAAGGGGRRRQGGAWYVAAALVAAVVVATGFTLGRRASGAGSGVLSAEIAGAVLTAVLIGLFFELRTRRFIEGRTRELREVRGELAELRSTVERLAVAQEDLSASLARRGGGSDRGEGPEEGGGDRPTLGSPRPSGPRGFVISI